MLDFVTDCNFVTDLQLFWCWACLLNSIACTVWTRSISIDSEISLTLTGFSVNGPMFMFSSMCHSDHPKNHVFYSNNWCIHHSDRIAVSQQCLILLRKQNRWCWRTIQVLASLSCCCWSHIWPIFDIENFVKCDSVMLHLRSCVLSTNAVPLIIRQKQAGWKSFIPNWPNAG